MTFNAISITWTQDLNKVYDALSTPGTDTSNVGLTLNDAWCNSSADVAGCKANVAAIQASLNSSISQLASQKASLGVNKPFVPPSQTQGSIRRGLPVQAARASKPTHLATIVLAAVKTFTLKPGQTKKVILAIPAAVRAELKQLLGNKRSRTIHGHRYVAGNRCQLHHTADQRHNPPAPAQEEAPLRRGRLDLRSTQRKVNIPLTASSATPTAGGRSEREVRDGGGDVRLGRIGRRVLIAARVEGRPPGITN